jgi:glycosyltransferase involved in cell wall biosynthesis
MVTLFYDTEITGHHSEYISYLFDYITHNNLPGEFKFILHPNFSDKFPDIAQKILMVNNIEIFVITYNEYELERRGNILMRSLRTYKVMDTYAKMLKAEKVCLLYFNNFQFALGLLKPKYDITGILFLQFSRMDKSKFKDKLKYFRKYYQTKFYIRNNAISNLFILNDQKSVDYLNKNFNCNIFKMIPDPVPELNPAPGFSIKSKFNTNKRKIYLHIGSLNNRKGTMDIINAFDYLDINNIRKIALFLVGKANSTIDNQIRIKKADIEKRYPEALLIYINDFIKKEEMKSFFDQCDIVLVPYKNVESSSGIIGNAIASGKYIIGPNKGLLGELIENNKLGITIENVNPVLIADAIKHSINKNFEKYDNKAYLESHTSKRFSEVIINTY